MSIVYEAYDMRGSIGIKNLNYDWCPIILLYHVFIFSSLIWSEFYLLVLSFFHNTYKQTDLLNSLFFSPSNQIPLSHISQDVYKTSIDWLGQHSNEALGTSVIWLLDNIFADHPSHQGAAKGSKKTAQQSPSKSQVTFTYHFLCDL